MSSSWHRPCQIHTPALVLWAVSGGRDGTTLHSTPLVSQKTAWPWITITLNKNSNVCRFKNPSMTYNPATMCTNMGIIDHTTRAMHSQV